MKHDASHSDAGPSDGDLAANFHARIDDAARALEPALRERRVIAACRTGLETGLSLAWVVPAILVIVQLMSVLGGRERAALSPTVMIAATLAIPAFAWFAAVLAAQLRGFDRDWMIARLDEATGAHDRLVTAEEFLEGGAPTSFHVAAIEDALPYAALASTAQLDLPRESAMPRWQKLIHLPIAAVLLLAATWIPSFAEGPAGGVTTEVARVDLPVTGHENDPTNEPDAPRAPEVKTPEPRANERRPAETKAEAKPFATGLTEDVKKSEGQTGEGQSSNAQSVTGASESRGAPTNQAQATKSSAENKLPPKEEPKKKDSPKPESNPRKKQEEDSGATAGRGSSKGSSKNPATTDWSSKDQVSTPDDVDLQNDEEVDDEEDDERARGGVQPSLRDRRPPVSRDLQIGFGSAKSPDANGRGGPSAQKKSRGTASLVLGVPLPDRVKGQPNPGRTKITQERVQPRLEEASPLDAEARTPRADEIGEVARPDLTPWMRRMIRDYFDALRTQPVDPPDTP